jgi:hypothetical protein
MEILLHHKADVDALPSKGNGLSAIEAAAKHGRLDAVKMLLNARDYHRRGHDKPQIARAKQHAESKGHFDVIDLLEDYEMECEQPGHVEILSEEGENNMIVGDGKQVD